jgi:aminoglycoside 6-adenylyltransferase
VDFAFPMRTETEIFDLILGFARSDRRIRAVVLNGSRANPGAPRDILQDYDIVYFVTDLQPYIRREDLPALFGEIMILQRPDEMGPTETRRQEGYTYLMQFIDGTRIDLTFRPISALEADLSADSLSRLLLDKDDRIPSFAPASWAGYLPQTPDETAFHDCCNEFWWLAPYVAKGLWRGELIGPKYLLDVLMRGELLKMLTWYYGLQTEFQRSAGKFGRFFPEVLGEEMWKELLQTYSDGSPASIWQALFTMGTLFRQTAQEVAGRSGFRYPQEDDDRVSAFIRKVQALPDHADSFDLESVPAD